MISKVLHIKYNQFLCVSTYCNTSIFYLAYSLLWFIFHHSRNLFEKTLFCMPSVNPQYDKRLFNWIPPKIQVQKMLCTKIVFYSLIQYKGYNSKFKVFDGVQFRKYFISLPAFYLIKWLMKSPKNFEKITILKIWWLVFFRGVKTHFGEIPL